MARPVDKSTGIFPSKDDLIEALLEGDTSFGSSGSEARPT
jgi:hypothetical protein